MVKGYDQTESPYSHLAQFTTLFKPSSLPEQNLILASVKYEKISCDSYFCWSNAVCHMVCMKYNI